MFFFFCLFLQSSEIFLKVIFLILLFNISSRLTIVKCESYGSFSQLSKIWICIFQTKCTIGACSSSSSTPNPKDLSPARLHCCKNLRNDCTICDSPRDQHLMKTGLFLEVSPLYCLWKGWRRSHSPTWSDIKRRWGLESVHKCSVDVCLCHIRRCRWKPPCSISWKE